MHKHKIHSEYYVRYIHTSLSQLQMSPKLIKSKSIFLLYIHLTRTLTRSFLHFISIESIEYDNIFWMFMSAIHVRKTYCLLAHTKGTIKWMCVRVNNKNWLFRCTCATTNFCNCTICLDLNINVCAVHNNRLKCIYIMECISLHDMHLAFSTTKNEWKFHGNGGWVTNWMNSIDISQKIQCTMPRFM
jgi:hypothetical protein